jgi:RNA polymerase sigma-70 factor (ECF subfamily)
MSQTVSKQQLNPANADVILIQSIKQGNAQAFKHLMQTYMKLVYSYVYRTCQQQELAEDMTQEIFVKVYQNIDKFDEARPFKPWLMRLASNHVISHLRKKSSAASLSLEALQEEQPHKEWGGMTDETKDPSVQVERQDDVSQVEFALSTMAPNYRDVLLLRFQGDLSYEEIALKMQVPVNTIRTWLKRGKERLQATLGQTFNGEAQP